MRQRGYFEGGDMRALEFQPTNLLNSRFFGGILEG